jgi:hypothetical protein
MVKIKALKKLKPTNLATNPFPLLLRTDFCILSSLYRM